jgi:hypothetical protein
VARTAVLLAALLAAGLGGSSTAGPGRPQSVSLRVAIREYTGPHAFRPDQPFTRRFTLRCDPTGGTIPNRAALCRLIAAHPGVMLPAQVSEQVGLRLFGCDQRLGTPQITVTGAGFAHAVSFVAVPNCGPVGLAYWGAIDEPSALPVAAVRLHCLEPEFVPTAPSTLGSCLNSVPRGWKPRP